MCLLFLLSWAFPAHAQEAVPPFNLTASYELTWIGLPFGMVEVNARETPENYRIGANIRFTGVIKLFVKHRSQTEVSGQPADLTKGPRQYESNYKTKNKPRRVKLAYDASGQITEEIVEPPNNPAKRPPVPAAQKNGSVDALSFIPQMRRELAKALSTGATAFSVVVYDGHRLTRANFTVRGPKNLRAGGDKIPVIEVTATRTPLAGFEADELEEYKAGDPPLTILFSPAPELIPLKMRLDTKYGVMEATRVK